MSEREKLKRQLASMRAKEDRFGDAVAELSRLTTLRPLSELTEADGMVLLWDEDEDGDGYWCSTGSLFAGRLLTDDQMVDAVAWSPLPKVRKPDGAR